MIIKKNNNIDEYISKFPKDTQQILQRIRNIVQKVAPKAEESIRYGIPTFKQGQNLVHFAAFKTHIGFYPTPSAIDAFKKELGQYNTSKGTIRFQLDEKIPYELIEEIVKFRVKEIEK